MESLNELANGPTIASVGADCPSLFDVLPRDLISRFPVDDIFPTIFEYLASESSPDENVSCRLSTMSLVSRYWRDNLQPLLFRNFTLTFNYQPWKKLDKTPAQSCDDLQAFFKSHTHLAKKVRSLHVKSPDLGNLDFVHLDNILRLCNTMPYLKVLSISCILTGFDDDNIPPLPVLSLRRLNLTATLRHPNASLLRLLSWFRFVEEVSLEPGDVLRWSLMGQDLLYLTNGNGQTRLMDKLMATDDLTPLIKVRLNLEFARTRVHQCEQVTVEVDCGFVTTASDLLPDESATAWQFFGTDPIPYPWATFTWLKDCELVQEAIACVVAGHLDFLSDTIIHHIPRLIRRLTIKIRASDWAGGHLLGQDPDRDITQLLDFLQLEFTHLEAVAIVVSDLSPDAIASLGDHRAVVGTLSEPLVALARHYTVSVVVGDHERRLQRPVAPIAIQSK